MRVTLLMTTAASPAFPRFIEASSLPTLMTWDLERSVSPPILCICYAVDCSRNKHQLPHAQAFALAAELSRTLKEKR
jgi:hypothetical protein